MSKIYGYCRVSTKKQNIERQIINIQALYTDAKIYAEAFTGTCMDRPEWNKLMRRVKSGDKIVFDSVSRMSRTAMEGVSTYFELYDRGVQLEFLKEHHIDTESYAEALDGIVKVNVQSGDSATDNLVNAIMEAINVFMRAKVKADIEKAFEQSEKEVLDLRQRTREGIERARDNGKQIGQARGQILCVKKKEPAMRLIKELSRDFDGTLSDIQVRKLAGISRNTYYKYKHELKESLQSGNQESNANE